MVQKILKVRSLREAGWLKLLEAEVETDGGAVVRREIVDHRGAVAVLPYDPERRTAVLVLVPRTPVLWKADEPTLLEAIAGLLDEPDAEACARREAREEAGLELGPLEPVATVWSTPGMSSERISLFLAPYSADDRTGPGGGAAGEHEEILVVETSLASLWDRVELGLVADLKTLALILTLHARRPELFSPHP